MAGADGRSRDDSPDDIRRQLDCRLRIAALEAQEEPPAVLGAGEKTVETAVDKPLLCVVVIQELSRARDARRKVCLEEGQNTESLRLLAEERLGFRHNRRDVVLGRIVVPKIRQPSVKMILADTGVEEVACQRSCHPFRLLPVVLVVESVAPPAQVILPYVCGDMAQEAMSLAVSDDFRLKSHLNGGELLCIADAWILADPTAQRLAEPIEGGLAKRAISDRLARFNDLIDGHRGADVPEPTLPRRVNREEVEHSPDDAL